MIDYEPLNEGPVVKSRALAKKEREERKEAALV